MDTTYYSFETRKIKVSGGADLLTIVPAAMPAPAAHAGEVLDFDRCRRKLETKAAWKDLAQAVAQAKAPAVEEAEDAAYEAVVPALAQRVPAPCRTEKARKAAHTSRTSRAPRAPRTGRAGGWLELCASVAVILVCLCAGWAFLALV